MSFKFPLELLVHDELKFLSRYGFKIQPELNQESMARRKGDDAELMAAYESLRRLPEPESSYFSSSDYERILNATPKRGKTPPCRQTTDEEIKDRILGGWLGKAAVCTLSDIKDLMGAELPLDNYLRLSVAERIAKERKPSLHPSNTASCSREGIAYAMPNDDLNYTVLGLLLLEGKGRSFSVMDVGENWAMHLPPSCTRGAETAAFINYLEGLPQAQIPLRLNPYRDGIGAQIRANIYGLACPAMPREAAFLAYRDASFSHVADGIYGSMFVAAMIASAFSAGNVREIVQAGLNEIPEGSRMAELLKLTLNWHEELRSWEAVHERIKAATTQYGPGHAVNNAAYAANAILSSDGDFEKGVATTSMQRHDTDGNGSTVGALLGVLCGAKRLPGKWIVPLNDTLKTELRGLSETKISELAERTAILALEGRGTKPKSDGHAIKDFEIRQIRQDDVDAIIALTEREFRGASIDARIEDLLGGFRWIDVKAQALRNEIQSNPEGCFAAVQEGRLLGYVTTTVAQAASRGVIANIAVSSECQGMGLGRKLIDKALECFRTQGLKQAKIETLTTNKAGGRLYPAVGFKEVARQIHFAMPL